MSAGPWKNKSKLASTQAYKQVRAYMKEHPGVTPLAACNALGIRKGLFYYGRRAAQANKLKTARFSPAERKRRTEYEKERQRRKKEEAGMVARVNKVPTKPIDWDQPIRHIKPLVNKLVYLGPQLKDMHGDIIKDEFKHLLLVGKSSSPIYVNDFGYSKNDSGTYLSIVQDVEEEEEPAIDTKPLQYDGLQSNAIIADILAKLDAIEQRLEKQANDLQSIKAVVHDWRGSTDRLYKEIKKEGQDHILTAVQIATDEIKQVIENRPAKPSGINASTLTAVPTEARSHS